AAIEHAGITLRRHRGEIAIVARAIDVGGDAEGIARVRRAADAQLPAVDGDRLTGRVRVTAGAVAAVGAGVDESDLDIIQQVAMGGIDDLAGRHRRVAGVAGIRTAAYRRGRGNRARIGDGDLQ